MQQLHLMKGAPQPICTLINQHVTQLVKYPDGSSGIIRDDHVLGIWEPNEEAACHEAFRRMASLCDDFPSIEQCELSAPSPDWRMDRELN